MSKLPILMYHHITTGEGNGLTIGADTLEGQFQYLVASGYRTFHLKDLMSLLELPSGKNIVLTFDDCYVNQLDYAYPLLEKYNLKATFFAPLKFLGKTDEWHENKHPIMSVEQLKFMNPKIVELAFHSFHHYKYSELSLAEVEADTRRCNEFVAETELNFTPAVAYPYGKYPKDKKQMELFKEVLKKNGWRYGLRIGNRINNYAFENPFEIERIDVKGEWSHRKFVRKLRFGKLF